MGNCIACLDDDQLVVVNYPAGKDVKHGPGCFSFCCASLDVQRKITLKDTEYVVVTHMDVGDDPENPRDIIEVISGPCLYELDDPYATISKVKQKPSLTRTQYLRVTDKKTGEKKVVSGPLVYVPGPYDEFERIQNVVVLNNDEYVYVTHEDTGTIEIVEGPTKFIPGAHDVFTQKKKKIALEHDEYVRIVDNNSGVIRVERGPSTVILQQYEKTIGNKQKAFEVNEHFGVYIKNTQTGNYDLITMGEKNQPFMYFPEPIHEIVERREKIRLKHTEVMVLVDREGRYSIMKGDGPNRTFFVPPYCDILGQTWSTDLAKSKSKVQKVKRFDTRPQFMDFEFIIRTKDNVEIYLDLNFFWRIVDVEKMILKTDDPPEDICHHAQSQILSDISRTDMKEFMESFNEIIQTSISKDDTFYTERGVELIRVEITGRRCKDDETERNFQEIIKEKTNRIKNLEQREGENEVKVAELKGKIEAEKLQGEVVKVQKGYMREEARTDGESDADKITNFLNNLPDNLTNEDKLKIYYDSKNTERLKLITINLAKTNTPLYITPKELDMRIMNVNGMDKTVVPVDTSGRRK